jgi:inorganic pyrophosphatase
MSGAGVARSRLPSSPPKVHSKMMNLLKLPTWADDDHVFAVIETPRGSTCKLDLDPDLGVFTLAKPLMAELSYPYDWGFIPSTRQKMAIRSMFW